MPHPSLGLFVVAAPICLALTILLLVETRLIAPANRTDTPKPHPLQTDAPPDPGEPGASPRLVYLADDRRTSSSHRS